MPCGYSEGTLLYEAQSFKVCDLGTPKLQRLINPIPWLEPALDANGVCCLGWYMLDILLRSSPMSFQVSLDRSGNNDRFRNDTCNLLSLGAMHCIDRLPT